MGRSLAVHEWGQWTEKYMWKLYFCYCGCNDNTISSWNKMVLNSHRKESGILCGMAIFFIYCLPNNRIRCDLESPSDIIHFVWARCPAIARCEHSFYLDRVDVGHGNRLWANYTSLYNIRLTTGHLKYAYKVTKRNSCSTQSYE